MIPKHVYFKPTSINKKEVEQTNEIVYCKDKLEYTNKINKALLCYNICQ